MQGEPRTPRNAEGAFEPFHADDVPIERFEQGARFASTFRPLGAFAGCAHVGVNLEELPPGKQACPAHYHMLEEEHLYVLEGRLTLRLGELTYELGPGHYVCFPAGQKVAHALVNRSDAPCRYLVIGERNPNDVIVYPDSGRVAVRALGEGYRKAATMSYWEGERVDEAP